MFFKVSLERFSINKEAQEKGQSALEYALLVAIAITALLIFNFVSNAKEGSFENHFQGMASYMGAQGLN